MQQHLRHVNALYASSFGHMFNEYQFLINSFMTEAVSYRNQFIDLLCKSLVCFLYDNGFRHERINLHASRFGHMFSEYHFLINLRKMLR